MLEELRIKLKFYSLKKKTTLNRDMCVLICDMCELMYVCVYIYIYIYMYIYVCVCVCVCVCNKHKLTELPVEMLIYIFFF